MIKDRLGNVRFQPINQLTNKVYTLLNSGKNIVKLKASDNQTESKLTCFRSFWDTDIRMLHK